MKRILTIIMIILGVGAFSRAQNLVPNYGFEEHGDCFQGTGNIHCANFWISPTVGDPEWNHPNLGTVPNNWVGGQYPHTGKAYVGFYTYDVSGFNKREYIQTQLTDTLTVNQQYYVSFYVSLADSSNWAADGFGVVFSTDSIGSSDFYYLDYMPQVSNDSGNMLNDKQNWLQISGSFTAQGGERYMTIGNFKPDSLTANLFVGGTTSPHPFSYYYIDDICVALDSMTCVCQKPAALDFVADTNLIPRDSCVNFSLDSLLEWDHYNWQFEGAIPFSDTVKNPVNICYATAGSYSVVLMVSDSKGCSDSIVKEDFISVAEPDYVTTKSLDNTFVIYPNPFSNSAIIKMPEHIQNAIFEIYDLSGKRVQELALSQSATSIKQDELSKGMYYYIVRVGESIMYTGKFVTH